MSEIIIIGTANESCSVPFGNLSSSANQQVEGVKIVSASPGSGGCVVFDSLSLGTGQISEGILVGLVMALKSGSIENEDVTFSAGLGSQLVAVGTADEGGTELDENLSVGAGDGVQKVGITGADESCPVPGDALSSGTLKLLES